MPEFGFYSVEPSQVAGMSGAGFQEFVGRMLDAERAKAGLSGNSLVTTYQTNVGDRGVDAGLADAVMTDWLPGGDSAWQFKAGDLSPSKCKTELRGATRALEVLRAGGSYRLVLGASLAENLVAARRQALEQEARDLGIDVRPQQIDVFNGDSLARWAESFPALAMSPLLHGSRHVGQTFAEWSSSQNHQTVWVASEARTEQINDLLHAIGDGGELSVHVDGTSGLGKTRLVMEAFRGQPAESLIVYVPSEDQFDATVLNWLHREARSAVVVIDECDARKHDVFAQTLQVGSPVRLITIGETSSSSPRSPVVRLGPFNDESLNQLILRNQPSVWPEAARVIGEVAAGNIDYAIKCAKLLAEHPGGNAAQLVTPDDIRQFITDELPGGALFLASCALALFTRIGFDGEVAEELTYVASALGLNEQELRAAAAELSEKGLLTAQGRYRSVGPNPVAIHLASRGWSEFGSRIVDRLVPGLSDSLLERLFSRATQIGDRALPANVVEALLGDRSILQSLETIGARSNGRILEYLAILSPGRVLERISTIVESASEQELRDAVGSRRALVWALQKLVWHTDTFEQAADLLLRLATVENENYANNSTGEWVSLFGTMLPSTAASPAERMAYLRSKAASSDERVRRIVVRAAAHALTWNEWVMQAGEVQGGVVVEPRGQPATWGDVWDYQVAAVDLLRDLVSDPDSEVHVDALKSLSDSIQGHLSHERVRSALATSAASFSDEHLRAIRTQLASLRALYDRVDDSEDAERAEEYERQRQGIRAFEDLLPPQTIEDQLWVLLHERAWDRDSAEVETDILRVLDEIDEADRQSLLLDALSSGQLAADWSVGHILSATPSPAIEVELAEQLDGHNPRALFGYLTGREQEVAGAADDIIDRLDVPADIKLRLTAQGAITERATDRVQALLPELSVATGARAIFYWTRDLSDQALIYEYVRPWVGRLETQDDYNAIVDLLALRLHLNPAGSGDLDDAIRTVVPLRSRFPQLGQQDYDWEQLASRQLAIDPAGVAELLVELVEADIISLFPESRGNDLFQNAVRAAGADTWRNLMTRVLDRNSFRLAFAVRGWLGSAVDADTAIAWVGEDVDRAKALAGTSSLTGPVLSPVVKFLINNFPDDDDIEGALYGELVSGSWMGNESDRIQRQVAQVEGWLRDPVATNTERRWCRKLIENLENRLGGVLRSEEEDDR